MRQDSKSVKAARTDFAQAFKHDRTEKNVGHMTDIRGMRHICVCHATHPSKKQTQRRKNMQRSPISATRQAHGGDNAEAKAMNTENSALQQKTQKQLPWGMRPQTSSCSCLQERCEPLTQSPDC